MNLLTGAMGAGKSTVLEALKRAGVTCVAEPAREILYEQRLIGASGVPEADPSLFCQLMLSRAVHDWQNFQRVPGPVFDRGIPDMVAYAQLFDLPTEAYWAAAKHYRYHPTVYCFTAWREIYTTDDERKINFAGAAHFGEAVREVYQQLGYEVVEVPQVSVVERVAFLRQRLTPNP